MEPETACEEQCQETSSKKCNVLIIDICIILHHCVKHEFFII